MACNRRAGRAPVIWPKLELFVKVAAVPAAVTDNDVLGGERFVWLITLKASTRNWNFNASKIWKVRDAEASNSISPGARMESRGTLPSPVATMRVRTPLMVE